MKITKEQLKQIIKEELEELEDEEDPIKKKLFGMMQSKDPVTMVTAFQLANTWGLIPEPNYVETMSTSKGEEEVYMWYDLKEGAEMQLWLKDNFGWWRNHFRWSPGYQKKDPKLGFPLVIYDMRR